MEQDEKYIGEALEEAVLASAGGDVPVGAVVVRDGEVIAREHNRREELHDATAHAEILALREAGRALGNWQLKSCTLYVTLEPCPMCAAAALLARMDRLVFGAYDPKMGALGSQLLLSEEPLFHHTMQIRGGVLADECSALLDDFFSRLRADRA